MTSSTESLQIRMVIKRLLKESGQGQSDLAKGLGVSVPTVKRILNGKELGLERLIQIAHFFRLSVYELFDLCRQKKLEAFEFTDAQEKFLAKELVNVVVFRCLVMEMPLAEIKSRYKFTDTKLEKILIGLDKVNLVEFWSKDKVKTKAKWPFKWIPDGTLQKTYMYPLLEKIFVTAYERSSLGKQALAKANFFRPFEILLRESSYEQLRKDLDQVLENYRSISKFEMMSSDRLALREVTGLLMSDTFSAWDRLLNKIPK